MNVSIVHVTPDAENLITKMARVSNPANENNYETAPRLLKYLINQKHWSPFEMASLCVEIETTRAIAAQILRHRSFSFQEFSQRYAFASDVELPELRRQDLKNRQSSTRDLGPDLIATYNKRILAHYEEAQQLYWDMVDEGVAKESARAVLPLNTVTRMYMHGSVRSFIHYVDVRTDPSTQAEHRDIALAIKEILYEELPTISAAAFNKDS